MCISVIQSNKDSPAIPRHAALDADVPVEVPAHLINRLCGSGFQSIVTGSLVSFSCPRIVLKILNVNHC